MTLQEVMTELEQMGNAQTKKVLSRHGAQEPFFGVKVGDMKKIQKKVKRDHELALALYATGNGDAMYLAGLISEPEKMTKAQIHQWAAQANWYMHSEYTMAWVAAESKFGFELARAWIDAEQENLASAGWSTWGSLVAITEDNALDLLELEVLLDRVATSIHNAPNRVRYTMNGFVIAVGTYVEPLLEKSKQVAQKIGKVEVEMGGTACKVPFAPDYIAKIEQMNRIGKKRKTAFC